MSLFRNVVFVAAISGLLAGLAMAILQAYATVPLILEAETFERVAPAAGQSVHLHGDAPSHGDTDWAPLPGHDAQATAPKGGFQRNASSALANIVTGVGFALLLVAVSELAGGIGNWRQGIYWGFAGFAVFTLAPGVGLPPELPAMPVADLGARQMWWVSAVIATAAGLALITFRSSALIALVGVALIVAPHVVGAPQPQTQEAAVPAELLHRFAVAVMVTNLVFWVLLGATAGALRNRFLVPKQTAQTRLA